MSELIDVYSLPLVPNVCEQDLREVICLLPLSVAHVTMKPGNVSLFHRHSKTAEIYFILEGDGMLYHGQDALEVSEGAYCVVDSNVPHKLWNTGQTPLEHLVIATPSFNPNDIKIDDNSPGRMLQSVKKYKYKGRQIAALDGALVDELMTEDERERLDIAMALGSLPPGRKAIPHLHKNSNEIYYVISGHGNIRLGKQKYDVKKGSVAHISKGGTHALENPTDEELKILCISTPAYTPDDFIKADA